MMIRWSENAVISILPSTWRTSLLQSQAPCKQMDESGISCEARIRRWVYTATSFIHETFPLLKLRHESLISWPIQLTPSNGAVCIRTIIKILTISINESGLRGESMIHSFFPCGWERLAYCLWWLDTDGWTWNADFNSLAWDRGALRNFAVA